MPRKEWKFKNAEETGPLLKLNLVKLKEFQGDTEKDQQ